MQRWIWITLIAVIGIFTAAALCVGPWARSVAREQAAARGLVLSARKVSVGFMRADLYDARVLLEGVEGVEGLFPHIRVDLGFTSPRVRRAVVSGGELRLRGDVDALRKRIDDWRARRPTVAPSPETTAPEQTLLGKDITIIWKNAGLSSDDQIVRGFAFERTADKSRVGAHLLNLSVGALRAEIAGAELEFSETLSLDGAKNIGAAEVRLTYVAQTSVPAEEPDKAIPLRGANNPDFPDESPGGPEGLGERMTRDPARVQKVRAALKLLRSDILPRLPPQLMVKRLWLTASEGDDELHVGPSTLSAEKSKTEFRASIQPKGEAKGTPLSASVVIPFAEDTDEEATLSISGGPVSLGTLGIEEGAFGLSGVTQTTVEGAVTAHLSLDGTQMRAGGQAGIHGLTLDSRKLADDRVSFPQLFIQGDLEASLDGSRFSLKESEFTFGEARFLGAFDIERKGEEVLFDAHAEAPLVSCQALLDSAPRGLLGPVEDMRLNGTFSLKTSVQASSKDLNKMKVEFHFENGCRASAVPESLDPDQFRAPFRKEVLGAGQFPMEVEFGPLSPSWVSYDDVSPFLEKALLVSEDGRFFRHNGIDDRAIESAIRDNTRAGKFLRGASTISMQLAKNLYLSRHKTLARKFQEAALTSLLEQSFTKKQLLELYVNVVEFGPGIYGVRRAAEHYFSTDPHRLTKAQCFFLASILPMPSREHFSSSGELLPARATYMHRLLQIAKARTYLTPEELEEALAEKLIFGQPNTSPDDAGKETDEPKSPDPPIVPSPEAAP